MQLPGPTPAGGGREELWGRIQRKKGPNFIPSPFGTIYSKVDSQPSIEMFSAGGHRLSAGPAGAELDLTRVAQGQGEGAPILEHPLPTLSPFPGGWEPGKGRFPPGSKRNTRFSVPRGLWGGGGSTSSFLFTVSSKANPSSFPGPPLDPQIVGSCAPASKEPGLGALLWDEVLSFPGSQHLLVWTQGELPIGWVPLCFRVGWRRRVLWEPLVDGDLALEVEEELPSSAMGQGLRGYQFSMGSIAPNQTPRARGRRRTPMGKPLWKEQGWRRRLKGG